MPKTNVWDKELSLAKSKDFISQECSARVLYASAQYKNLFLAEADTVATW